MTDENDKVNISESTSEQNGENSVTSKSDENEIKNQNNSKQNESEIKENNINEPMESEMNADLMETEDIQPMDNLSETDEQSLDRDIVQENPEFVHVTTKSVVEADGDKSPSDMDLKNDDGINEEDPIDISHGPDSDNSMEYEEVGDKQSSKDTDFNSDKTILDEEIESSKGADEELCIIPDIEREITQEEKDAATAAVATVTTTDTTTNSDSNSSNSASITVNADDSNSNKSKSTSTQLTQDTSKSGNEKVITVNSTDPQSSKISLPSKPVLKITKFNDDEAFEETCHQCNKKQKCIYTINIKKNTDIYVCSESCLISFRSLNKPLKDGKVGLKIKELPRANSNNDKIFIRRCAHCFSSIFLNDERVLSWETMDFCDEDCLGTFQQMTTSHCANCKKEVEKSLLGKYCVRFGNDIRQFCTGECLAEFKKSLKLCTFCQKDISAGSEGFLAPVGDVGQFKDFCSQMCLEKYVTNDNGTMRRIIPVDVSQCSVCNKEKQIQVYFDEHGKVHKFCGDPCFVAFKFVNQNQPLQCDTCKHYYEIANCIEFSIFTENKVKNFCCKTCQNIFIISNRKIVSCSWCKVKKYNYDMIKNVHNNGQVITMCSLNCLGLFRVSVKAVSSKKVKCDHCSAINQAQYHLTMSDASMRNFCSYQCVMSFQNQYAKIPISMAPEELDFPIPAGIPKLNSRGNIKIISTERAEVALPVIKSVQSLATTTNGSATGLENQQSPSSVSKKSITRQQIIINSPYPDMSNAATMCKPILCNKKISCKPIVCSKETQTDPVKEKTVVVPIPVPIYVPSPLPMFSAPVPVPIAFPLPIPVPIFIPTTRNSAAGIMKEIKKIQVKIPTDPFEAELLMMAEMVAGDKKIDNTDSESEEEDNGDGGADAGFSPETVDTSNTFGDDMLQMALKMATELDEPAVDLEGALTANTITASQSQESSGVNTEESVDDTQPIHQLMEKSLRGRKRTINRQPKMGIAKRGRRITSNVDIPMLPPPAPVQPPEPIEKPDANMCLKFTFGVNAWKQWVTTKNAELEKSSRRVKLFKNEILQLTADELNYSLCLFVKEVRKPNGSEYAPDTIYYLCLGIQQYLFENGRIDNIFTDAYYEKFTDCLDEIARKFSILYNDSHYIVTRVEEEHLWESKQLGAHSPHVLLSTLMFFNTKHFNLTTVDEHMQLSFSHIMKHWKRNPNQPGTSKIPGSRNVLLRFYPPQNQNCPDANSARKKKVYEQQENEDNPLRCPVKLYEFYLSKCPESVKTRNDVFYLLPERSCVPDSPVWYSTMALGREALEKMLHRVKMVKEINVALLTS